ncbi:ATP-binding protein [Streptomyces sp. NPDC057099]|uniref:ATP-binding protein n=1 Tax=Streptomyces sp. NPDC057099 TaxID=3346019 RepID=UPI00363DE558
MVLGPVLTGVVLSSAWAAHALGGIPAGWLVPAAALGCGGVIVVFDRLAIRMAAELHQQRTIHDDRAQGWLRRYKSQAEGGQATISVLLEQLDRGEQPERPNFGARVPAVASNDPWREVETVLIGANEAAWNAVMNRRQVELASTLVYLAGGLQTLVVRALGIVTERTQHVSDPDELHTLFDLANLLRRIRRSAGRLAVLGGTKSRQVAQPVPVLDVLRGAAAEIEKYARVRIPLPKVPAQVPGVAGPDVIHILSELAENATLCSPPETKVLLRAEPVRAGLAVEVEDRGWGLNDDLLHESNRLLADPQASDLSKRLRQRQVGLLVVAKLARRYGIKVELRSNITGGTTALVVVPWSLLEQPGQAEPVRGHRVGSLPASPSAGAARGGPRPRAVNRTRPGNAVAGDSAATGPRQAPVRTPERAAAPVGHMASAGSTPPGRPVLPQRPKRQEPRQEAVVEAPREEPPAPPQADFVSNITGAARRAEQDWSADAPQLRATGPSNHPPD